MGLRNMEAERDEWGGSKQLTSRREGPVSEQEKEGQG